MKTGAKLPRNPFVLPMTLRWKGGMIKDRRVERGGNKNIQAEYLEEYESEELKDTSDGYSETKA